METGKVFHYVRALSLLAVGLAMLVMGPGSAMASETQTAVVATVAPDYSSGADSVVSVDPVGGPRSVQNDLNPTVSDISVASYEKSFYILARTGRNNVTRYNIDKPSDVVWQWSTEGSEEGSNPHDLIFESGEKAYLLRYGSNNAWIVNPSATAEADFKIGELDLSAYSYEGNPPGMHSGVIVDGRLFITLQRFDSTWTPQTAYVAVFDVETDTEIDTGRGSGDMLGIPLPVKNPGAIQYLSDNDTIYVQGSGHFFGAEYSSGIAAINPGTYEVSTVLDDGDDESHPYGFVVGMSILSPTKGYFVGYAKWGDNTLYTFDPSEASPSGTAVSGFEHIQIAGMESGVYFDRNDFLWVCNQTTASVDILDTATDTVDESVGTNLNPSKVVFCVEDGPPAPPAPSEGDGGGCFIDTASGSGLTGLSVLVILSLVALLCLGAKAWRRTGK